VVFIAGSLVPLVPDNAKQKTRFPNRIGIETPPFSEVLAALMKKEKDDGKGDHQEYPGNKVQL
jgi:hypothetical protein